MATSLLAIGTTALDSSSVTLASGEFALLFLTGAGASASAQGLVTIQVQSAAGAWTDAYSMEGLSQRTARVDGPLTFRVRRRVGGPGAQAVGVDRG